MRRTSLTVALMVMVVSLLFAGWAQSADATSNTGARNLTGLKGMPQPHPAAVPKPHPTNTKPSVVNNNPTQLPVLWVHGIITTLPLNATTTATTCQGGISADNQPATLRSLLPFAGYTGPVLGVAYYCGDNGSFDIRGCSQTYTGEYNNGVSIEQLGLDLAWCIYNNYSQWGQYINLAGHSMGGLIIDEALTKAGTQGYPQYLLVRNVVTYSTPYAGTDRAPNTTGLLGWCGNTVQCQELTPSSAFSKALLQRLLPSTVNWTTIGGGPADNVDSYASSSAVNAQNKVEYYAKSPVNYNHNTYFTDPSGAQTEPFRLTANGVTTSYVSWHATALGALALAG